jgi:hypothetical protein
MPAPQELGKHLSSPKGREEKEDERAVAAAEGQDEAS